MLYATLHAGIASLTTAAKRTRTFSKIADVHMSVEVSYYSVNTQQDTLATRLLLLTNGAPKHTEPCSEKKKKHSSSALS